MGETERISSLPQLPRIADSTMLRMLVQDVGSNLYSQRWELNPSLLHLAQKESTTPTSSLLVQAVKQTPRFFFRINSLVAVTTFSGNKQFAGKMSLCMHS